MRFDTRTMVRQLALLLALLALLAPQAAAADDDSEEDDVLQEEPEASESIDGDAEKDWRKTTELTAPSPFDDIMRQNMPEPAAAQQTYPDAIDAAGGAPESATVEVPLAAYTDIARRLDDLRRARARKAFPKVVLGKASYEGEVTGDVLALRLKLHVTLAGEGLKTVPLAGDDTALLSATADGEPIGVTRRPGYHVWVTHRRGVVALTIDLLVPARGKRGSIEYAFRAARTPSATLSVRLPAAGLLPRFDGAIESDVRADNGGTRVHATLEPTTEIRLVGFRDIGATGGGSAKVYAETSTLLSVDERAIEMFTVARYNILYAAAQSFDIFVPAGLEVVSADGEGAFRYSSEPRDGGVILRGETAFPIQGSYELSLRLRYRRGEVPGGERAPLHVLLPRCMGVEREHGWLAVEVPGNVRLEEVGRRDLAGVDVRQLPTEVVASAVSPILKAYRYHMPAPALELAVERLPEQELADGAIDRIEAVSVLSPEGRLFTELRITLRNALRPSLTLALQRGAEVRSALLDGEPIKPSRVGSGDGHGDKLLLPLKRSRGQERQEPFTLLLLLESTRPPLGLVGMPSLSLPAADLTVASLKWQLHLPANNHYGALRAAIAPQAYAGDTSWHKPAHVTRAVRWDEGDSEGADGAEAPASTASRIELPRTGVALLYSRHWVSAGESVRVDVPYVRFWLLLPFKLLLAALLAVAMAMAPLGRQAPRRGKLLRGARLIGCALLAIALWQVGWAIYAASAAVAGGAYLVYKREGAERVAWLAGQLARLPARLRTWRRKQPWSPRRLARGAALALGCTVVAWMLATRTVWLIQAIAEIVNLPA